MIPEVEGYAPVIPITRDTLLAPEPARPRVRIRKLRVLLVLLGLAALGAVSFVFGMVMAVMSDLPTLEQPAFETSRNSELLDRNGRPLGLLTGSEKRIFLRSNQIAPVMKQAIIAVEDRRFYTNEGIDVRGIGRALWQDVIAQRAVQGGSTITQQFIKNALAAQEDRTLFNKMREAALAYQITRKWSKERILRNYLNTIYFGNGAYGIESAARTYFGNNHPSCGESGAPMCAQVLAPEEAALLAGLVASPSGYDPLQHRAASKRRRDLVLQRMVEQGYLSPVQYREAKLTSLPTSRDVQPPNEDTKYPYFTSWIKQQVVDRLGGGQQGARRAFEGGLAVRTTLDSRLQDAAQNAINQWLPWTGGPRASLVAIKNDTGEVLAMVGGDDYAEKPFNLATQGQRQPGSAFKPFVLAEALTQGISPESTWASQKTEFCVVRKKGRCIEAFKVNNYENSYAGVRTLRNATTFSDNSVYAQVGIKAGTGKVARRARRMGIRTPVSKNMAITLGGLKQGVTPLDMAHAYETLARARPAHLRDDEPRVAPAQAARAPARAGPGGDPADQPQGRRQAQAGRPAQRRQGDQPHDPQAGARGVRRRHRDLDPHLGRGLRHGHAGADRRPVRRRQDGHDGELRRRLVRRLEQQDHGRRVGRLSGQADPDADRVQRPAGGRRHLPGGDLADVRGGGDAPRLQAEGAEGAGARDPGGAGHRAPAPAQATPAPQAAAPAAPAPETPAPTTPAPTTPAPAAPETPATQPPAQQTAPPATGGAAPG